VLDRRPKLRIANLDPGLKLWSMMHEKWYNPNATAVTQH
jgi:hypothetical protein